jgi:hypothetical protein
MRHLGSLIAGIVAVPLGWLLLAFGQVSSAKAFATVASTGRYHPNDFVRPLIFLAVAGIVIGLIATLRISPVGPLVAGIAFAGSYVTLLIAPKRMYDAVNYNVTIFDQHADLTVPLTTGTALAIGATLLVAIVSVSRWRSWPRRAPAHAEVEPTEPTLTDDTLTAPSWNAFASSGSSDLPSRTSTATFPTSASGGDETTESVPAKGRSPWDTPLRGTSANQ